MNPALGWREDLWVLVTLPRRFLKSCRLGLKSMVFPLLSSTNFGVKGREVIRLLVMRWVGRELPRLVAQFLVVANHLKVAQQLTAN